MPAPKKSMRPKARSAAPKTSKRPKGRDDDGPQEGSTRHPSGKNINEQDTVRGKAKGGMLKDVPAGKKGLSKLPTEVRNKMGYKAEGGKMQKMAMGGKCRGMGAATRGGNYKMG